MKHSILNEFIARRRLLTFNSTSRTWAAVVEVAEEVVEDAAEIGAEIGEAEEIEGEKTQIREVEEEIDEAEEG